MEFENILSSLLLTYLKPGVALGTCDPAQLTQERQKLSFLSRCRVWPDWRPLFVCVFCFRCAASGQRLCADGSNEDLSFFIQTFLFRSRWVGFIGPGRSHYCCRLSLTNTSVLWLVEVKFLSWVSGGLRDLINVRVTGHLYVYYLLLGRLRLIIFQ